MLSRLIFCLWLTALTAQAQTTRLKLSNITPGTEQVQLVYNGDFQFQGPTVSDAHPYPVGWARQADIFADAGRNMVGTDGGVVARAQVDGGAAVCKYERTVNLEPNTDYVLSAYIWNMGDSGNHVTTVIDFNDAPQEPQITLSYSDANADLGYFVYRTFNTTDTGSTITLRAFYDNRLGTGAAASYLPIGAQWDNIAITKAGDFAPPQPNGSGANLRPVVSILDPLDGTNLVFAARPAVVQISASTLDYDGTVNTVEFYAGADKLGEASPTGGTCDLSWTIPDSGSFQLTAVAIDDGGAKTVSAPVTISASLPAPPPEPVPLSIALSGTTILLSWPTSATALSLQSSSNLGPATVWRTVLEPVSVSNEQNGVTLPLAATRMYFRLGPGVDPTTLDRKLLMGYQGWFACPSDGSPMNRWVHWFSSSTPTAENATVDFWPDTSELDPDELFPTGMTMPDGSPAYVYSAFNEKTVARHFKWMKENNLDGVFLQRFCSELSNPSNFAWRNGVTLNVKRGAEAYGRVFAIMYDISGQNASTLISTLTNDWNYLVNTLHITDSPAYIRHHGKPVLAIWGFGFTDRPGTPDDCLFLVNYFKSAGLTVMGGVPTYWRTLDRDSQTDPAWANAYRAFDIISPWAVGRFSNLSGADSFRTSVIIPDLADTQQHGIEYMPVLFPGFSWHNLKPEYPLNQIPRNGGAFYWRQVYNAVAAHCTMLYGAMFDEMNEGTSMFKMAPTAAELPAQGTFVPLNIDGQFVPSDWYLRLADQASRMLRGETPLRSTIPIVP